MRRRLALLLMAAVAQAGCDIDFVAVEQDPSYAVVAVESLHEDGFEASVEVSISESEPIPRVVVEGIELPGELREGRWGFVSAVPVDTLHPLVRLAISIGEGDPAVLRLPLLARSGAAVRRPGGDLELGLAYGGTPPGAELTWDVRIRGEEGAVLMVIHATDAPLPSPLVLGSELIPPGAVAVEVSLRLYQATSTPDYPVSAGVSSHVWIAIPAAPVRSRTGES